MSKRILLIGSGGREHAIALALVSGANPPELIVAPGNPGTAALGENVDVAAGDVSALVALATERKVDLVIPGPEAALVAGIADALADAGIPCCGPSAACARLEGSKAFTRELAERTSIPSPHFEVVHDVAALQTALDTWEGLPPVVKADGLAGGKGVFLPADLVESFEVGSALLNGALGAAGETVVLEERLVGVEASLFYACHGEAAVELPHARDHKRLLDGDAGPNTGGMGAISPNPLITPQLLADVRARIVEPTLRALAADGTPYVGFLFLGLMLTNDGPKLLEYNVRLGDPETQAILPRLPAGAMSELCVRTAGGELEGYGTPAADHATCCVVVSARGYPDKPQKGDVITGADALTNPTRWLVHAGTTSDGAALKTSGGRVAAVVARAASVADARAAAYQGIDQLHFDGMHARRDIGEEREL